MAQFCETNEIVITYEVLSSYFPLKVCLSTTVWCILTCVEDIKGQDDVVASWLLKETLKTC